MKNGIIALTALTITALSTQSASATSPRCTTLMNTMAGITINIDVGYAPGAMESGSAGGLSFLGATLVAVGAEEAPRNPSLMGSGISLTALGGMLVYRAFREATRGGGRPYQHGDSNAQNTTHGDPADAIRSFRQTEHYTCIRADLGNNRAEEFVAEMFAGWNHEALASKYLSPSEQVTVREQIAYLQSLNTQQDNPCADEGMSCEG